MRNLCNHVPFKGPILLEYKSHNTHPTASHNIHMLVPLAILIDISFHEKSSQEPNLKSDTKSGNFHLSIRQQG